MSAEHDPLFDEINSFLRTVRNPTSPLDNNLSQDVNPIDVDDRDLTGEELLNEPQVLLKDFERILLSIPTYLKAAARAHFRGKREVAFSEEGNTSENRDIFIVDNDFRDNRLRITRMVWEQDLADHVVGEIVQIFGGDEEDPPTLGYMGADVFTTSRSRPNEHFPKYGTLKALECIRGFRGRLEAIAA